MNAVRLAFGLLTAVPTGALPRVDRRAARSAMLLAPVTALPVVAVVAAAHAVVSAGAPSPVAAALVVAFGTLYSRAMHLDGLADTADGLSAGYDAESSLRAMKASDTGPSGVAAVTLALLVEVTALASLLPTTTGAGLACLAWVASRHTLAVACRRGVPAARPEGLGALVAGTVGPLGLAASAAVLAAVAATLPLMTSTLPPAASAAAGAAGGSGTWWLGLLVAGSGLAASAALVRRCRRRLGGVSGDVLGAGIEVALSTSLAVGAIATGVAS
ncbi:MAG TPA: adenosylcobinamide-GDP ribazoletransferase [Pedococcus sp.]